MGVIDLNEFRYEVSGEEKSSRACAKPSRKKPYEPFLKSIPLGWIKRATAIPGRALHAAIALRHISALQKSRTVKMQRNIREQFGLTSENYNQALIKLEEAGLVTVDRFEGQAHIVTIIEIEDSV